MAGMKPHGLLPSKGIIDPAKIAAWVKAGMKPVTSSAPAAETQPVAPVPGWQDSIYNQQIGNIDQNTRNLLGGLKASSIALGADYGVTGPAFDPTTYDSGSPPSYSIDPNVDVTNPFSRAALLKKAYQNQSRGDTNSLAARGQLYSGALQNAQNADTSSYNQGNDALLKDYSGGIRGLYGQWLANNAAAGGQRLDAAKDAFARHPDASSGQGAVDPRPTPGFTADPNYNGNPNNLVPVGTGTGVPERQTVIRTGKGKPKIRPKGNLKVVR